MTDRRTEITAQRRELVVSRLSSLDPEQTDTNLLASLRRSCGLDVVVQTRRMFPENGPMYHEVTGVAVTGNLTPLTAKQALSSIEDAMEPATVEALTVALTRLSVITAARAKSGVDVTLMASAYLDDLLKYPADIALSVLRKPRQWWPTLYELTSEADRLLARRNAIHGQFVRLARDEYDLALIDIAKAMQPQLGGRKLPEDWRERAGLKATKEDRAKRWDDDLPQPNKEPVSVSPSLAASLQDRLAEDVARQQAEASWDKNRRVA